MLNAFNLNYFVVAISGGLILLLMLKLHFSLSVADGIQYFVTLSVINDL